MKIDEEDFKRKAEHIIETVVKPQVERYERAKAIEKASANLSEGKFILASPVHKIFYRRYRMNDRFIKAVMGCYKNNEED